MSLKKEMGLALDGKHVENASARQDTSHTHKHTTRTRSVNSRGQERQPRLSRIKHWDPGGLALQRKALSGFGLTRAHEHTRTETIKKAPTLAHTQTHDKNKTTQHTTGTTPHTTIRKTTPLT